MQTSLRRRSLLAVSLLCVGGLAGSLARAAAPDDAIPPRRIVYVLAGQSNIEYLLLKNPAGCSTGGPRWNVTYYAAIPDPTVDSTDPPFLLSPPSNVATTPLMELGDLLGQHHAPDLVDVVMMARSGSALLWRNRLGEAWLDAGNLLGNHATLMNRMVPVMQALAYADELHVVWGQGETDCISNHPQPTQTAEYWYWAQSLFAWLALQASHTSYDVHLVTLGAILQTANPSGGSWYQTDADANQIRDAYFLMERFPLGITGMSPTIASVAHHYDLQHDVLPSGAVDPYHLAPCEYVVLGRRIAEGITAPASLPKVAGLGMVVLPNGTDVQIQTTSPLVAVPIGTALSNSVEVLVNGAVVPNAQVGANGTTLTVRVPAGGLTPTTSITVRHVPGSGFGDNWTAGPFATAAGSPLEPFVLSQ